MKAEKTRRKGKQLNKWTYISFSKKCHFSFSMSWIEVYLSIILLFAIVTAITNTAGITREFDFFVRMRFFPLLFSIISIFYTFMELLVDESLLENIRPLLVGCCLAGQICFFSFPFFVLEFVVLLIYIIKQISNKCIICSISYILGGAGVILEIISLVALTEGTSIPYMTDKFIKSFGVDVLFIVGLVMLAIASKYETKRSDYKKWIAKFSKEIQRMCFICAASIVFWIYTLCIWYCRVPFINEIDVERKIISLFGISGIGLFHALIIFLGGCFALVSYWVIYKFVEIKFEAIKWFDRILISLGSVILPQCVGQTGHLKGLYNIALVSFLLLTVYFLYKWCVIEKSYIFVLFCIFGTATIILFCGSTKCGVERIDVLPLLFLIVVAISFDITIGPRVEKSLKVANDKLVDVDSEKKNCIVDSDESVSDATQLSLFEIIAIFVIVVFIYSGIDKLTKTTINDYKNDQLLYLQAAEIGDDIVHDYQIDDMPVTYISSNQKMNFFLNSLYQEYIYATTDRMTAIEESSTVIFADSSLPSWKEDGYESDKIVAEWVAEGEYGYIEGVYDFEKENGARWASTNVNILLDTSEKSTIEAALFFPNLEGMSQPNILAYIYVNDCLVEKKEIVDAATRVIVDVTDVNVCSFRIVTNAKIIDTGNDKRELSYLLYSIQ